MENQNHFGTPLDQPSRDAQQSVVLTQLLQDATTMRHVDELLLWLAHAFVSRFDVQVTQFWAMKANRMGQLTVTLRTLVSEDLRLPQGLVVNKYVCTSAERLLRERRQLPLQAVGALFPHYYVTPLRRHGVQYCAGSVLSSTLLLPPAQTEPSADQVSTPLWMAMLLFFRRVPSQELLPTIDSILQQALPIATSRGLLLEADANVSSLPTTAVPMKQYLSPGMLFTLVPQRLKEADLMRRSNPLARSVGIADKQARRLYVAIDGRKSVGELVKITHLDRKEIVTALRTLLAEERIRLYGPGEQLVDPSSLLPDQ